MNVEIGAEAALFPEKEYINGIAVAVWVQCGVPYLLMVNDRVVETLVSGSPVERGPDPTLRGG
jgi:hypothetical protein